MKYNTGLAPVSLAISLDIYESCICDFLVGGSASEVSWRLCAIGVKALLQTPPLARQAWPRCQPQLLVALSPSGQSLLRQTPTENWRRPAAPKTDREHIFPKRREPAADAVDKITLAKVRLVYISVTE